MLHPTMKQKIMWRLRDKPGFHRPANLVEFYGFEDYGQVLVALNELSSEGKVMKRSGSFWKLAG